MVKEHAQWRNPALESRVGATRPPVVEGVGAAISAWFAGGWNRILRQELPAEQGKLHVNVARDAAEKELDA